MEDPAYRSGVNSESIVSMLRSISDVLNGKASYIVVPEPIDRIAPTTHISFYTPEDQYPEPLRTTSSSIQSRRSYSYSLSNPSQNVSYVETPTMDGELSDIHSEIIGHIENITADIDAGMVRPGLHSSANSVESLVEITDATIENTTSVGNDEVQNHTGTEIEEIQNIHTVVNPVRHRRRRVIN
jgi:hypothetical protein